MNCHFDRDQIVEYLIPCRQVKEVQMILPEHSGLWLAQPSQAIHFLECLDPEDRRFSIMSVTICQWKWFHNPDQRSCYNFRTSISSTI